MAVKSVLNPEVIVGKNPGNIGAAKNFISGGSLLGSSVVASAANKIVGFQRSAAVRPVVPDINSILNAISSNIINNVSNSIQTVTNNLSRGTSETIQNVRNEIIQNINKSIITNKSELINYVNQINVVNKKEFVEKVSQIIDQTNIINENVIETKEELIQYVDNIFKSQDITNLITNVQNNVSNNIQRIEGRLSTIQFEKINEQIIQGKAQANIERKIEEIINQTVVNEQQVVNAKQELIQYVDNVFKTQDITNIVNNIQNKTFTRIENVENEINQIKQIQASKQYDQQSTIPESRNTILNVETTVQNIIQSTRDTVDNIQRQTSDFVKNTVDSLTKNYQQKVREVDDTKPVGILERFLKAYNTAIGFIQFFGSRKNMDRLRKSLSNLKTSFTETFDVAKLVRQVIVKIVKQLSNLPKVSPSGGGGINLDVDVPGSPLKRAAPQAARRMGMGKMLGYGALGAGAVTGGSMIVNALSDTDSVQPMIQDSFIPQGTVDMFSTIVERFTSAVDNLLRQAQSPTRKSSGSKVGKAQSASPATSGSNSGSGGGGGSGLSSDVSSAVQDPNVKAFLDVLAKPESGGRYNVSVGGKTFTDMSKHPEMYNPQLGSDAAGRYQFISTTWKARAKELGLKDFSPESQDLAAVQYLKQLGVLDEIMSGDPTKLQDVKRRLEKSTWTGLRKYDPSSYIKFFQERKTYYQTNINTPGKPGVPGKQGDPGKPGIQGKSGTPGRTIVSPVQQQSQQIKAQTISQPPPSQQQSQVNIMPINLSGASQQTSGKGEIIQPPQQPKQGPSVPFMSPGNPENFLILYSKMVYNIVDG